jgi:hypothetical protein
VRWIRLTVKKCGRAKEESRFHASGNGSNDRIIYDNDPVRVPRSGKSPAMILIFAHGGVATTSPCGRRMGRPPWISGICPS